MGHCCIVCALITCWREYRGRRSLEEDGMSIHYPLSAILNVQSLSSMIYLYLWISIVILVLVHESQTLFLFLLIYPWTSMYVYEYVSILNIYLRMITSILNLCPHCLPSQPTSININVFQNSLHGANSHWEGKSRFCNRENLDFHLNTKRLMVYIIIEWCFPLSHAH